jgi:bifunctional DNA-binding transcriptional regulator/antitoxin component of YhaV-PrlF toxin-antitoxin module
MAEVTVDHKGRIALPPWAAKILGAQMGKKLRIRSEGDRVVLSRIAEIDPFEEAMKKPAADAFEKMMDAQEKDKAEAEDRFEELIENPPEVRPEDNEDLWR